MGQRGVSSMIVVIVVVVFIAAAAIGVIVLRRVEFRVSVSISPSSQSGDPGSKITYAVEVKNTGNASNTYLLAVEDTAGWANDAYFWSVSESPGESLGRILNLNIPSDAVGGTIDNITVTANGTNVIGSESCRATVNNIIRSVSVSISPTSSNGANGATLSYTVTVFNAGNRSDTYSLAASDNASPSWSPSIFPSSLTISPSSHDYATLTVIAPSNGIQGTNEDVAITVTATGTGVSGSDNCTVLHLHYSWNYNGQEFQEDIAAAEDELQAYQTRPIDTTNSATLFVMPSDRVIVALAKDLKEKATNLDANSFANFALGFVQSIPYGGGQELVFTFPYDPLQILVQNSGNCTRKSSLYLAIMKADGYDVCELDFSSVTHEMAGVHLDIPPLTHPPYGNVATKVYYDNGRAYYPCETTSLGWLVGEISTDVSPVTPKIIVVS